MKLDAVDLNLLKLLDVVLEEGSVTRAGRRVGLSQSATSHALDRLRVALGDPLLVRVGRTLKPTARALELKEPLRKALAALETAMVGHPVFDPATTKRTFRIATTDYATFVLLPRMVEHFCNVAPGIDIAVLPFNGNENVGGLPVDAAIGLARPDNLGAGVRKRALFSEEFSCLLRKGHPALSTRWDPEKFAAEAHILVAPGGTPGGIVDGALGRLGLTRRVVARVPHFLVAPFLIGSTDLVLTLPSRVARAFARQLPLEVVKPPLDLPGFSMHLMWSEAVQKDEPNMWFRRELQRIAASLTEPTR